MKLKLFKGRATKNRFMTILSVVVILLILCLNLALTNIGQQNMLVIDTTYEGLYTLTPLMKERCSFINGLEGEKVKITFCSDPDTLVASDTARVVYFMSLALAREFDNIEVETVNVTYNPTAVSKYKSTSLKEILPTDVIISYGDRYRIVSTDVFWVTSGGVIAAYYGEYKMTTLIMSVTSVNRPSAYFVTDHGETYYDALNPDRDGNADAAYLYEMLLDRGMQVKTLSIGEVDAIPDDCVLLVINNPRTDFTTNPDSYDSLEYISDTEKLDRYLVERQGAIMVAKDYSLELPVFEEFLYEWGFDTSTAQVKDDGSYIPNEDGDYTNLVAVYDTDEDSYGYAIYGEFASLSSAPSMIFSNTGYISCSWGDVEGTNEPGTYDVARNYAPFFFTSPDATAYEKNSYGEYLSPTKNGQMDLAAVSVRMEIDSRTGEYTYSYVFCANSPDFFSNDHLGNPSFANYEVMSALVENISRTDEYADIELGSTSANSSNRGGKILLDTTIYDDNTYEGTKISFYGLTQTMTVILTVIIMIFPFLVLILGTIVRIRRKFL